MAANHITNVAIVGVHGVIHHHLQTPIKTFTGWRQ
jgi:hypothetical protein